MFHLFAFLDHYPSGGLNDYKGSFASCEEAVEAYESMYGSLENGEIACEIGGKLVTVMRTTTAGWMEVEIKTDALRR